MKKTEVIITLVILAVLLLIVPPVFSQIHRMAGIGQLVQSSGVIYAAVHAASKEAQAHNADNIGFPGDMSRPPTDFIDYIRLLSLAGHPIKPDELVVDGVITPASDLDHLKPQNCAFSLVYVNSDSDEIAPFFFTKNLNLSTQELDSQAKPFGDEKVVIMRKDGECIYRLKDQYKNDPSSVLKPLIFGHLPPTDSFPLKWVQTSQ